MPGLDGRGPQGMGPMTGRGQGRCAMPASRLEFGVGYGRGRGCGFGSGRRLGQGVGWGRMAAQGAGRQRVFESDERRGLQEEAAALEVELQRIRQRIDELS